MASETMIQNAKAFLLQESPDSKLNLYDHLCSVMHKVLENRTPNSVDLLESLSKDVKTGKFAPKGDPTAVSYSEWFSKNVLCFRKFSFCLSFFSF